MVIKVYITGISASKEIKKRQQRALMILDSLKVRYEAVDLSEPGHDEEKEHMKTICKKKPDQEQAFPPQFFNEDTYCGDYEDFELASDDDTVLSFLKIEDREDITIENGEISPKIQGNDIIDNLDDSVIDQDKDKENIQTKTNDEYDEEGEVIKENVVVEEKMILRRKGKEEVIDPSMTAEDMIKMIKSGDNKIIEETEFEEKMDSKEEVIDNNDNDNDNDNGDDNDDQVIEDKKDDDNDNVNDDDAEMKSEESEE